MNNVTRDKGGRGRVNSSLIQRDGWGGGLKKQRDVTLYRALCDEPSRMEVTAGIGTSSSFPKRPQKPNVAK